MGESKAAILIVEDEENLQEALKLNLELEGYDITCAENGAIALKKVEEGYFDLIILDVMLPEIDGFDVCESIRLQNIETPLEINLLLGEIQLILKHRLRSTPVVRT